MRDGAEASPEFPFIGSLVAIGLWLLWSIPVILFPGMTGEQVGLAIGISLTSLTCGLFVAGVMHAIALRALKTRNPITDAVIRGAAGATVGLTLAWLLTLVAFPIESPAWLLVVIPALAAPWALNAIERIAGSRRDILNRRQELIDQAVELMASNTTQQSIVEEVRNTISLSVHSELALARADVARQLRELDRAGAASVAGSRVMSSAAHDSVQPVVRMLTSPQSAVPEPLGAWGTIRAIVQTQPFHPVPLAIIYALVNGPSLVQTEGAALALIDVSIGVALIFGILMTGNEVMRRGAIRHDVVFVATFIVLQIPTVVYLAATSIGSGQAIVGITTSVVVSSLLVLMTSSLGSWRQRQEGAQETFRELLHEEQIAALALTQVAADIARQAAHTLHGPVQARLAACAVAMERATQAGDLDLYRRSLLEAQAILEAPLFPPRQAPAVGIGEAASRASEPWAGLVGISTNVEPSLADAVDHDGCVEKIVEEAITNAVRHGHAKNILVVVSGNPDKVEVHVHDDGSGPGSQGPGVGSRMLDRVTNREWSLSASSQLGGAVLHATLDERITT